MARQAKIKPLVMFKNDLSGFVKQQNSKTKIADSALWLKPKNCILLTPALKPGLYKRDG